MVPGSARWQIRFGVAMSIAALVYSFSAKGDRASVIFVLIAGLALIVSGISSVGVRQSVAGTVTATTPNHSIWPFFGAGAAVLTVFGFANSYWYLLGAAVVALIGVGGALAQSWKADIGNERTQIDLALERIVRPVGLPVVAFIGVGVFSISVSRVLLSLTENVAVVIAIAIAIGVMVIFSLLAFFKDVSRPAIYTIGLLATALTVTLGAVGASKGETKEETVGVPAPTVFEFYAQGTAFVNEPGKPDKVTNLSVPANQKVTLELKNFDHNVFHNISIYTEDSAGNAKDPVFAGQPVSGGHTSKSIFPTPAPGVYVFRCDFHPLAMKGILRVSQGSSK